MGKTIFVLKDICCVCGQETVDHDTLCWRCKAKIHPCEDCYNQNTTFCLTCKNWRVTNYESTNTCRN